MQNENHHHDSSPHPRRGGRNHRSDTPGKSGSGGAHSSAAAPAVASHREAAPGETRKRSRQEAADQLIAAKPSAFLNVPFHPSYESICISLISGLTCLGITPRIVTEIPESEERLAKLKELILACDYSFHDLSYVSRDGPKRVPRFNMPFECGLAIGLTEHTRHEWYVLEKVPYRLQASLSDLNGRDPLIHFGKVAGIHSALLRAFSRRSNPPSPVLLHRVYRRVCKSYLNLKKQKHGTIFDSPVCFRKIVYAAIRFWGEEQQREAIR